MKTRLFDFSCSVPADRPLFDGFHGCSPGLARFLRQLTQTFDADFRSSWGPINEGESPAPKRGVTELVFELLSHSNQCLLRHMQPLCSQTSPVTHPSDTSNASTDPLFRHPPTGCRHLCGETRMDSIFLEITLCNVSCL